MPGYAACFVVVSGQSYKSHFRSVRVCVQCVSMLLQHCRCVCLCACLYMIDTDLVSDVDLISPADRYCHWMTHGFPPTVLAAGHQTSVLFTVNLLVVANASIYKTAALFCHSVVPSVITKPAPAQCGTRWTGYWCTWHLGCRTSPPDPRTYVPGQRPPDELAMVLPGQCRVCR